jgi:regulator of nucleoside diphosphate kinase
MSSAAPKIRISDVDHRRLTELVRRRSAGRLLELDGLEDELERAEVVPAHELPDDVVAMESTVVYEDVASGKAKTIRLTYPEDANVEQRRISVLAPIGAALLGLKVGAAIDWPLPGGKVRRLRVKRLLRPPPEQRA